jgi:hypothetical protein
MPSSDSPRPEALLNALNQLLENQRRLEQRIARLEKLLLEQPEPVAPVAPIETPAYPEPPPRGPEPPKPIHPPTPPDAAPGPSLESKVGLTVVNRIGVLTLVLGVAFFFKWAVDNKWIGPAGRVVLGLLAGLATLGIADLIWRKRQQVFAQGITAAGIAIIYLALYAAFDFYHLIPQSVAFAMMVATTATAAVLALRYNSYAIAALALAAGYLTPLLLSTHEDHPWFLFSYLLLLNFAATELAKRGNWRGLELISFVGTTLIYGGWLMDRGPNADKRLVATLAPLAFCAQRWRTQTPLLFSLSQLLTAFALAYIWRSGEAAFFALALLVATGGLVFSSVRGYRLTVLTAFAGFWLSYVVHNLYSHESVAQFLGVTCGFLLFFAWSWWHLAMRRSVPTAQALSVFAVNGVVYYAGSYYLLNMDHRLWLGPLAALVAASYLAFGVFLHRRAATADARPILLALGVALSFVTLAIPIQFTGFTITIAWALQAAALAWIASRLGSARTFIAATLVFGLVVIRLLLFESEALVDPHSYSLLWNSRFLTFAVSSAAMLLASVWGSKVFPPAALAAYFAGHIILLWGLCMEILGWAERSAALENRLSVETIAMTILFGIYAVILVGVGVAARSAINRLAGLGLTGIVILKLYLFDVWQLSRPYQISAFVVLGILLLATSFLYSHFRRLIENWWKNEKVSS